MSDMSGSAGGVDNQVAVVGGGLVGMALAFGLQRLGRGVTVFDQGDDALRASRGNFGLVWVQGKGVDMPVYARWSRLSASLWPAFAAELQRETGLALELRQPGGVNIFLSEREAEHGVARLTALREALGGDYPFEYLGHNTLRGMIPQIGPEVVGASYCPEDGHVNPLYLLRALHAAFARNRGVLANGASVTAIEPLGGGFRLRTAAGVDARFDRVVLCAGLGNAGLAPQLGLYAPVAPQRGQVLICERVQPFLNYPSVQIRQVGEGAVQIGDSKEDVGFDDASTPAVIAAIAARAVRTYPLLQRLRVVRSWGALRVMSPDGHPIYQRSASCPGASLVTCHSGVTLAAAHALVLAAWIAAERADDLPELSAGLPEGMAGFPDDMEAFSAERFALHQTA